MNMELGKFLKKSLQRRDTLDLWLLRGTESLRRDGIELFIRDDFDALLELNRQFREHWFPLMPMFDASFWEFDGLDEIFWIEGKKDGETICAQSARLYLIYDSSLHELLTSMQFFYSDPEAQSFPREACACGAFGASVIQGRVCYSGGTWAHPAVRGGRFASILPRLSRALALKIWEPDYTISLVDPILIEKQIVRRYGYRHAERGVHWKGNEVHGDLDLALIWMDRPWLERDVLELMTLREEALA